MINRIETNNRRSGIHERVKPFQQVVGVAMDRLGKGSVNPQNQHVVYLSYKSERLYKITNDNVVTGPNGTVNNGSLTSGLSIEGIALERDGKSAEDLTKVKLPRSIVMTRAESIPHLSDANLDSIAQLTVELSEAEVIDAQKYTEAYLKLHPVQEEVSG